MTQKNLTLTLIKRERSGHRRHMKDINVFLEKKTAQNNSVQLTYHQHDAARSTFVITFSPDRTKIATTHGNHTVKVSDCFTCKVIHTLHGHVRTPWCVTFHPKINSILASGCLGGQVRLWDLNNLYNENLIYSSQSVIASLVFHPVDDVILIGTTNRITFFEWNQRLHIKTIQTKHYTESIRLLKFLPYGDKLITGIANASTQYCKPTSLNVSTRGDPLSGQPVVQTVSCLRMQKRHPQTQQDNHTRFSSPTTTVGAAQSSSEENKLVCKGLKVSIPLKKLHLAKRCETCRKPVANESSKTQEELSELLSTSKSSCSSNEKTTVATNATNNSDSRDVDMQPSLPCDNNNQTLQSNNSFTHVEREQVSLERQGYFHRMSIPSSSSQNNVNVQPGEEESSPLPDVAQNTFSREQMNNMGANGRHVRSEIWNFTLGGVSSVDQQLSPTGFDDMDISVESSSTTIPVHGFVTFPSVEGFGHSASVSNLNRFRTQTAVATATARSSHHVHTAVVIASQEDKKSEVALQTAVNRAIAGAFAGSGEGAVANNIIDTTHRLQLWDLKQDNDVYIQNEEKNVIVPFCKIHNDSSVDVSQDGSFIAVFVPNKQGFPKDAELQVISLKPESYLHCLYSRKFGPNAISISLSPLNRFVVVGLASRKLHWHVTSHQLVAQILQLPIDGQEVFADSAKAVSNILHQCNETLRSNVSVNTVRFHPTPGMGIIYGTNRGHIQHCLIGPDLNLSVKPLSCGKC